MRRKLLTEDYFFGYLLNKNLVGISSNIFYSPLVFFGSLSRISLVIFFVGICERSKNSQIMHETYEFAHETQLLIIKRGYMEVEGGGNKE